MATKFQLLVVACLASAALTTNVSKKRITVDPMTAKEAAATFQEAIHEEAPLLKEEEEEEKKVVHKSLVRTQLRASKTSSVVSSLEPNGGWATEFEKDVSDLVMGLSAGGLGSTPFGASVQKIQDVIDKDMMPKVVAAHNENQKELLLLATEARAIEKTRADSFLGADGVTAKRTLYETKSAAHKHCRTQESALYKANQQCILEWKQARQFKVDKCAAFTVGQGTYATQIKNRNVMNRQTDEKPEVYLRRVTSTFCGPNWDCATGATTTPAPEEGALGGMPSATHLPGGYLHNYLALKQACDRARTFLGQETARCEGTARVLHEKRNECDTLQDEMDDASCKFAIAKKNTCQTYLSSYPPKRTTFDTRVIAIRMEELERKAEWSGLTRMKCLISAFGDGNVTQDEITQCKNMILSEGGNPLIHISVKHLNIYYPEVKGGPPDYIEAVTCGPEAPAWAPGIVWPDTQTGGCFPDRQICAEAPGYPNNAHYKAVEYAVLPADAKGRIDANDCAGIIPVNTDPKPGSPASCNCTQMVTTGQFEAGALIKCENCHDVSKSTDENSCPTGTKIWSPRSRADWDVFLASVTPINDPNFIVDITRPLAGGGAPPSNPFNSNDPERRKLLLSSRWTTADGSPFWLRSTAFTEPSGDYTANCYLNIDSAAMSSADTVAFDDSSCNYHSKSYYCQSAMINLTPKDGAPDGCTCKQVQLDGTYSAGTLIKCSSCKDVWRSVAENSCPYGTKIFSPRSREDWKTFLASAEATRAPHFIMDVTRPQDGCGGCKDHAMASTTAEVATWKTSDSTPWWIRADKFTSTTEDYKANCFLNMFTFDTEDSVAFDVAGSASDPTEDGSSCKIHSTNYFCQPELITTTTTTTTPVVSHSAVSGSYLGTKTGKKAPDGYTKVQDEYCLADSTTKDETYGLVIGTVCCTTTGTGSRPGCNSGTYETAEAHCVSQGLQLCTLAQLKAGAGEAAGCDFDASLIWSSDGCQAR